MEHTGKNAMGSPLTLTKLVNANELPVTSADANWVANFTTKPRPHISATNTDPYRKGLPHWEAPSELFSPEPVFHTTLGLGRPLCKLPFLLHVAIYRLWVSLPDIRKNNTREAGETAESWNTVLYAPSRGIPSQTQAGAKFLTVLRDFCPEENFRERRSAYPWVQRAL